MGKKVFLFKDDSGNVEVEIEPFVWQGQHISPQDKVKLYGKVDKDWGKTELEIHRVVKL